ncbi:symmetrical bis(5'-nucleosyl)-tetraphosphatase, partial [Francisella tularensis subsp. holarctica]|nr:symmetrical bis(5'-nucleosyl)-tetraphosphatase [Francisella tularensis subsp. holarctica]
TPNQLNRPGDVIIPPAGSPPIWSPQKALKRANEVEFVLKNQITRRLLLANHFSKEGEKWEKELEGIERWLCLLNYYTRI